MKRSWMKFAAASALAAGMAFAQAPAQGSAQPGHARHHFAQRQKMMQALNLTDAQKAQAKTIFQQARQSAQPLREQLKQNHQALAAAVKADDVAQIRSLSTQAGALRGQMMAVRSEAMAKFYATLTPEQRTQAAQLRQQKHRRS